MLLSDNIARMIEKMLDECGGSLDIQRNEMATKIGCVPSQISYVITSRFTPERGYIIESRKGGGGYIRITRKQMHKNEYLMHFFSAIDKEIDENEAYAYLQNLLGAEIISVREYKIISNALSASALSDVPSPLKNIVRAQIFRLIIMSMIN